MVFLEIPLVVSVGLLALSAGMTAMALIGLIMDNEDYKYEKKRLRYLID